MELSALGIEFCQSPTHAIRMIGDDSRRVEVGVVVLVEILVVQM